MLVDIEIRKIGKSYHFKIEIKIQTFESSEEVKSVRRYHPYVVQNERAVMVLQPGYDFIAGFNGINTLQ